MQHLIMRNWWEKNKRQGEQADNIATSSYSKLVSTSRGSFHVPSERFYLHLLVIDDHGIHAVISNGRATDTLQEACSNNVSE